MKLHEAIRLGAMLKPQGFGVIWAREDQETSCALEAAAEAFGVPFNTILQTSSILSKKVACPVCDEPLRVNRIISIHLNDRHRWTREAIADWVRDTFENDPVPVLIPEMNPTHTEAHAQEKR